MKIRMSGMDQGLTEKMRYKEAIKEALRQNGVLTTKEVEVQVESSIGPNFGHGYFNIIFSELKHEGDVIAVGKAREEGRKGVHYFYALTGDIEAIEAHYVIQEKKFLPLLAEIAKKESVERKDWDLLFEAWRACPHWEIRICIEAKGKTIEL